MKPNRMIALPLATVVLFTIIFPAFVLAADAARVAGDLKVDGLYFSGDPSKTVITKPSDFPFPWVISDPNIYYMTGNVGIGTMSPSTTLDVYGTVNATQISGNGSISGTSSAGSFNVNNPSNTNAALYASTNGAGPAVRGFTTGTGNAGSFTINNVSNSVAALYASSNGSGNVFFGTTTGTGNVGRFDLNNSSSENHAVFATSNGTKPAVYTQVSGTGAAGVFWVIEPTNPEHGVYAQTVGTGWAGGFKILNPDNSNAALYASTSGTGPAVFGRADGAGTAGSFKVTVASNQAHGVYGETVGTGWAGGFKILNPDNSNAALYASTNGTGNAGRFTINKTDSSANALYATTNGTGYAAYFDGKVHVNGTFSKLSGSFKIDHPLDPRNKYLYHSFVESSDMKNIYDGVVVTDGAGYATVKLPAWFEALNRDYRYQLTVIDESDNADFVRSKVVRGVAEGSFTLRTSTPNTKVSWQVTGIRQDAYAVQHPIPLEEDKGTAEKGTCLYSQACDE